MDQMTKGYPLFNRDRIYYEYEGGYLRIGADDDDTAQIRFNTEIWRELIECSDGTNSIDEICSALELKFGVPKEKTITFIRQFESRHLIEIFPDKYVLSEKNRYFQSVLTYYSSRGLGGQKFLDRLQSMKVTVLGCGGGGSQIAFQLSQLGIGRLHIVDPDIITTENVNRQSLFTMSDIGQLKVEIAKSNLTAKNPYIQISSSDKRLSCVADVIKEIDGSDWVICAMDEPPYIAQRITNRACMELNIPSVYCFSQKSAGKMFMVNPHVSGCADCLLKSCDDEDYRKLLQIFMTSDQQLITANIYPNITLLCSWVAKKWLDVVAGKVTDVWNKLFRYDFDLFKEEEFVRFEKLDQCTTCGTAPVKGGEEIWEILKIE